MEFPDMTRRFICRTCQRETGHWPIGNGQIQGSEQNLERNQTSFQTFEVVRCKDCGTTTYCIDTRIHPGSMVGDSYIQETTYYPALTKRTKPSWYTSLAENYKLILSEVYTAIDNELFFLASSGTRTALDQLIVEKIGGDIGTFEQKVQKLFDEKIIDEVEKEMLLAVIDTGNASAHRNYRPDFGAIDHMMDILETIFYKLLIAPSEKEELKAKAQQLRNLTPKRNEA
jgi:hypothetical protein